MKKLTAALAAALLLTSPAHALNSLDERIAEANGVLKEFKALPEDHIPPDLLKQAQAIAIFPNTGKAGFVFAAQFGKGVVVNRTATGWSAPAFFRISGGSVGFQIGGQVSDIVLVITNEQGVNALLENKFTIGADASAAAGPVGRDAAATTDWKMQASILSYSRSKGLFAGVSVDGMVINRDDKANAAYHGPKLTVEEILLKGKGKKGGEADKLTDTIEKYAKG